MRDHGEYFGGPRKVFHYILSSFLLLIMLAPAAFADQSPPAPADKLVQSSNALVKTSYHSGTGKVRFMSVEPGAAIPNVAAAAADAAPADAAASFLSIYGPMFGINNASKELRVKRQRKVDRSRSFVRYQQLYKNVPVFGGELLVQMDSANNVVSAHGKISPDINVDATPALDASASINTAVDLVAKQYNIEPSDLNASTPELWIYNPVLLGRELNRNFLVWRIDVRADSAADIDELVLVDAHKGFIALHFNQTPHAKNRTIYDNQNNYTYGLPGYGPARTEGGAATGISDVDLAYTYFGYTYDFYWTYHGRDSLNNLGMPVIGTVRYCPDASCPATPYQNAFWSPSYNQMVFGEGFASALDVVAHELTHGVTQYESGLIYYAQSGAVSESLSDVWGELIQQEEDPPATRWLIGENLPTGPIRSMSNPPDHNQPDKMTSSLFLCDTLDNGEVHKNSGVDNKAAYLMVDGGSFNSKIITGIGITKTIKIYYEAQTNLLMTSSDYADLYDILQLACSNLIGTSGITASDCQQVKNALDAVEMNLSNPYCQSFCPAGTYYSEIFYDKVTYPDCNWSAPVQIVDGIAWTMMFYPEDFSNYYMWGMDLPYQTMSYLATASSFPISSNTYLHFVHNFDFEYDGSSYYDGGTVAYSTDGGASWNDADLLFINNGYNDTIYSFGTNPLGGSPAFVGRSNGFISSRLNLGALAGQNVMLSFWVGTDSSNAYTAGGWSIDDIRLYICADTMVSVTVNTLPAGRQTEVDGNTFTSPKTFSWPNDTPHMINVSSPQSGTAGTRYLYSSWSDGGAQSHSVTTPASTATYTANFTTQHMLTTSVNPAGAGSVSPDCSAGCWYDSGATPGLTANANGGYVFGSWSGGCAGTSASTSASMTEPRSCTANFAPAVSITVSTSPAGRQIIVDSVTYTAPQTFSWAVGSSHAIDVDTPQTGATDTRYVYSSWSDGGAQSHSITTPALAATYTANFATEYRLTTSVNPPASGTVSPDCAEGCWYNSGYSASLSPTPSDGNTFSSWTGDISSLNAPLSFTMNGPKDVTANFDATAVTGPVRIVRTPPAYFTTIPSAYAETVNNDVIQMQATSYTEALTFDRTDIPDLTVTLKGGYTAKYSDNTAMTTISSPLTVVTGTISLDNIIIE